MEPEALTEDTTAMEAPTRMQYRETRQRRATGPIEAPPRPRPPRLGSFITIAAAVLMLFGAASRMGKIPETAALFGIDRQAERIRQEEDRLRTALTIGAVPVPVADLRPPSASVRIERGALPPPREETDPEEALARSHQEQAQRAPMSMAVPEDFWRDAQTGTPSEMRQDGDARRVEPGRSANPSAARAGETYVVANGDTWTRIAKRFLGDGKRWQEIQNANPESRDGLRVGMRLVIPKT